MAMILLMGVAAAAFFIFRGGGRTHVSGGALFWNADQAPALRTFLATQVILPTDVDLVFKLAPMPNFGTPTSVPGAVTALTGVQGAQAAGQVAMASDNILDSGTGIKMLSFIQKGQETKMANPSVSVNGVHAAVLPPL